VIRIPCVLVIGTDERPADGADDAELVQRTNDFLEYSGVPAHVWHLEMPEQESTDGT